MLTIFLAALLPALILMWYVYRKDLEPEPVNLVVKGFIFGAIATFVSTLISGPLLSMGLFTNSPSGLMECLKVSFLGAAIPEEDAEKLTTVGKVIDYLKSKGYGDDGTAPAQ